MKGVGVVLRAILCAATLCLLVAGCGSGSGGGDQGGSGNNEYEERSGSALEETTAMGSGATVVTDDTGALSVEVPAAWSDVDGAPEELSGVTADATVTASADVAAFREGYEEAGVSMSTSTALAEQYTPEEFLDLPDNDYTDGCDETAREPYDDGTYVGYLDAYTGCGESLNEVITIAGVPASEEYMLVIVMQTSPDEAGKQAQERIILSSAVDESALP
jgi:serine protease Do